MRDPSFTRSSGCSCGELAKTAFGHRRSAFDAVQVASGGAADRRFGIGGNNASGPPAVEAIERVRLDRSDDAANGVRAERNQIWVALHEAHPASVGHDLDRVAGEERARTPGAGCPVQDATAREMPAAADEG